MLKAAFLFLFLMDKKYAHPSRCAYCFLLARLPRFERGAFRLGGERSIQLSYKR